MDVKTNPTTQSIPPQAPPGATPPAATQQPAPTNPPSDIVQQTEPSENNKLIFWLIGGLVIIVLAIGGVYIYLSSQQQKLAPAPSPSPAPKVQENLERELNSLTIEDLDSEFQAIDKDLESL